MGCPMFEKKFQIAPPKSYPFETLYRPWSWIISSSANLSVFLLLLFLCYALFKRSRSARRAIGKAQYRSVTVEATKDTDKVKVLVTGGCGCFGQRLIHNLVETGNYEIHCLDLFIPDDDARPAGVSSFIAVDLSVREALEIALKQVQVDVVFHVAALLPKVGVTNADLYRVNRNGTQNLIDFCKLMNVRRFIFTSTCDVLLSNDKNETLDNVTESHPLPSKSLNGYCGSKKDAEKIVIDSNGQNGMTTCSLRCAVVAHPRSLMFRELLLNRGAFIGNGLNKLSLVDADLCAMAHVSAEKKLRDGEAIAGQVYNIAGDSFSVKELMEYSCDDSNITIWGHPKPLSIPKWFAKVLAVINMSVYYAIGYTPLSSGLDLNAVEFMSHSYTFDSSKAKRELVWEGHPSWKEVVEKIVDQYEEELETKKRK